MKIHIESAIKLDSDQVKEIKDVLSKKIDGTHEFEFKVSPEVLGGLRVTMGGSRIDASLSGKLDQVSTQIL